MHLAITNHTGARNRGAEALVRCMADGFRRHCPELAIALYSSDPLYDQWRFQHAVTACWGYPLLTPNHARSMVVNRLAYRAAYWAEFALPATLRGSHLRVQRDLRQAAVAVAAGGDIFTSDYHNLRKHLAFPLMARGTPMYLCSHSIGPFTPADRDYFCRAAEKIDLITVREGGSFAYLRSLGVQTRVEQTADVAFTLAVPDTAESKSWLAKRYGFDDSTPCVGLAISQGIIKYSALDADAYYQCFAEVCDALLTAGKQIMLIPHVMERHPANNDVIACDEVLKRISANGRVTVLSGEPGAVALKGAIGQCEALIGTRTHAAIASMSQGIPTVSVAYSRKAYGIMEDVYGHSDGPALTVAAEQLSPKALLHALEKALATPINASHLADIKQRAERNFTLLNTLI